jgi:hypothetical protein
LDPESSASIPVQDFECKAVVPTNYDWTTETSEYYNLFFDQDLLDLILHTEWE